MLSVHLLVLLAAHRFLVITLSFTFPSLPMRHPLKLFVLVFALIGTVAIGTEAIAADSPAKPNKVISNLRQQMYTIGETSGKLEDYLAAEHKAVLEIRAYLAQGEATGLQEKTSSGQTPLMAAAINGYAEIVAELLKSEQVRAGINDTNPQGFSAWLHATWAFRQSMWVCNPQVFKDPFTWVPLFVIQPYYIQSPENPYRKTRRLLEQAGAIPAPEKAKQSWLDTCKMQDQRVRSLVEKSSDLLETVLAESPLAFAEFSKQLQTQNKK
ncbi:ankyrin repeat domain-containing protein [Undibacterium cyanobacteriorum]|uniref:Ankyrin repeat domain-containing protein n=1 Tax=Undibacterium cyanobacteriorum TaxID=3073561 RepID=A0ABY9RKG7_9BURK|nr:ankyrin repeat domain-containing protein [Undibacterium sp. 20NA77.5]WMW81165.1 ankyrin repeat domain-containing protein [Undibacterium sp. 20NA77.5]